MTAEAIELELVQDLEALGERFPDEEFSTELYRALTNNVWCKDDDGPEGHLSLSWGRAEELVNQLRARFGQQPLTLAQTGGEGEVSDLVADELGRLGWRSRALNTGRRDDAHLAQPEAPPPRGQGERDAPAGDEVEWEERAHAEAEANRPPWVAREPSRGDDS